MLRLQQRQSRVTLALAGDLCEHTARNLISKKSAHALGLVCVRNVLHSPGCSWTLPCSRCGPVSTVVDCAQLASPAASTRARHGTSYPPDSRRNNPPLLPASSTTRSLAVPWNFCNIFDNIELQGPLYDIIRHIVPMMLVDKAFQIDSITFDQF